MKLVACFVNHHNKMINVAFNKETRSVFVFSASVTIRNFTLIFFQKCVQKFSAQSTILTLIFCQKIKQKLADNVSNFHAYSYI